MNERNIRFLTFLDGYQVINYHQCAPLIDVKCLYSLLNLVDASERINPARSLDDLETQLLERIMLNQIQNRALLVGDLINLSYLGSKLHFMDG